MKTVGFPFRRYSILNTAIYKIRFSPQDKCRVKFARKMEKFSSEFEREIYRGKISRFGMYFGVKVVPMHLKLFCSNEGFFSALRNSTNF